MAIALVLGFGTLPMLACFRAPFPQIDEAALLIYAEQLMDGRFPGRDFFTVYGPGGPAALAAIFWTTGPSVAAERALGLAYHLAVASGITRLTRPYGIAAATVAGLVSTLFMLPVGLTAYGWFGGLGLAVWSLALLAYHPRNASALVAGLLAGLVAAWRVEMLVLLVGALPLICRRQTARPYLLGAFLGLAPTCLPGLVGSPGG